MGVRGKDEGAVGVLFHPDRVDRLLRGRRTAAADQE
jgi:hypothetical protein